jgi:hypothetical protein
MASRRQRRDDEPADTIVDKAAAAPARRHLSLALRLVSQLCALYPPCGPREQGRADRCTSKAAAQQACRHTDRLWTLTAHPHAYVARPNHPKTTTDQRFRWSALVWSPPPESNRRPHPYHGTTRNRCADRRFPRSRPTVRVEVIGSLPAKVCAHFKPCAASIVAAPEEAPSTTCWMQRGPIRNTPVPPPGRPGHYQAEVLAEELARP